MSKTRNATAEPPKAKKFSASFAVDENSPEQVVEHYKNKVAYDLGKQITDSVGFQDIPTFAEGYKSYMARVVVASPEEYERLKDIERKYNDLQF